MRWRSQSKPRYKPAAAVGHAFRLHGRIAVLLGTIPLGHFPSFAVWPARTLDRLFHSETRHLTAGDGQLPA